MVVPLECTGWTAADAVAEAHAEFDDGKRLHASGTSAAMGAGEKTAALMECFAGARPWREHLYQAAHLIGQYRYVGGPRVDRLGHMGGSPDQLLRGMLLGDIVTVRLEGHPLAGQAAKRALVKWHFEQLDRRARVFARAQRIVSDLIADPRADAMRATKLWAAVLEVRLEAAAWLSAWSDEFSAGRAGFVQADVAPPAIQLVFSLSSPEGWPATQIDTLTDRFMASEAMQQRFLTFAYDRHEPARPVIETAMAQAAALAT